MEAEILNVDYNNYVELLGTAHFTRRSLTEAYEAVRTLKPTDLAVELDLQRFQALNWQCADCPESSTCAGRCEFVGAADALGNIDANIWLIDMTEAEITMRVRRLLPVHRNSWFSFVSFPFWRRNVDEVELWESGRKREVLERHAKRLEMLRAQAPHVWRVLIDERNVLMAARLAWIVTQKLAVEENVRVLTLTGAAHVEGIQDLLRAPHRIREGLRSFHVEFSAPTLVRRVGVN